MSPRRASVVRALALCAALASSSAASAQSLVRGARVAVNAGVQTGTIGLDQATSAATPRYLEPLDIQATLPKAAVPFFDAGITAALYRSLGFNVSFSYLTANDDAQVTAQVPHPFYYEQKRTVSGAARGVEHSERAVHLDGVYLIASPTIDLALFGGVSFVNVNQDFVSDVTVSESYPYDTAAFTSAQLTHTTGAATGYNVGADVTWKLGPRWGVGGLLRYTRADVPLSFDDVDAGKPHAGGLQAGGGIRLLF